LRLQTLPLHGRGLPHLITFPKSFTSSNQAAISTRGDLNPINGTWEVPGMSFRNHGSLDYKGTNYEMFKQLRFEVIT